MFGYTNPTGDNSGGIQTTGPSEAQGRYPQLFITSPNYGPGLQIKTKGVDYSPRTVIGDGLFDNGIGITSAGTGPDITQEFFAGAGYNFKGATRPLISYHHKITNASNTGVTGPVFSISTFVNSGVYNPSTTANKTLIQTTNSNRLLELMSNGKDGANQVRIGTNGEPSITVWGPSGPTSGGVSIGVDNLNYPPLSGALTGTNFKGGRPPNHSLVVTGVQTIGTNDPESLFHNPKGFAQNTGKHSLLKISRFLAEQGVLSLFPTSTSVTGPYPNSYPNGIEITSFISSGLPLTKGTNRSVAIAVGATTITSQPPGTKVPANTTGFFVSDTGENISVGQYIDSTAAIGVSGAGSDLAIRAKGGVEITGNVGVTGTMGVIGNVGITGDVDIRNFSLNNYLSLNNTSRKTKEYHGAFSFTYNTAAANPTGKGSGFTFVNDFSGLPPGFSWNNTSSFNSGSVSRGFVKINTPGGFDQDRSIIQITPRYNLGGTSFGNSNSFQISGQFNVPNEIIFYFKLAGTGTGYEPSGVGVGAVAISFSIFEQEW
jgi:hypothetical protein